MEINREALFWLIGTAVLVFLLWLLHSILLPFVAGMAIAYFLDPVADWLEKLGLSRRVAVTVITLTFALLFALAMVLLVPLLINQLMELINRLPHYLSLLRSAWNELAQQYLDSLPSLDIGSLRQLAQSLIEPSAQLVSKIWSQSMAIIGLLSLLVVTPIVAVYLLLDWDRMVGTIDEFLPRHHAPRIRQIFRDIDRTLAGFVRGQGTVCLLLGTFYAVGLTLAGLQFGVLVGLGSGLISFIPYVGSIIGGVVAGVLAIIQFWPDFTHIAIVFGVFALGQFLEGNFLSPKLIGDRVRLHPVWIMFALFAFGYLFGFVGVLIAMPLAATIGVLTRHGLEYYRRSQLYEERQNATSEATAESDSHDY